MWTSYKTTARRFWDFAPATQVGRQPAELAEGLRSVFIDGVLGRLRSLRPVWAEQSGGFDSSAIVCAADHLLRSGRAKCPGLETISYSVTAMRPEHDFIRAVEDHCKRNTHRLNLERCRDAVDPKRSRTTPLHPAGTALSEYRLVTSSDGHVLMSGRGGDQVMGNTADDCLAVLELLAAFKPMGASALARQWSRASKRTVWDIAFVCATSLVRPTALRLRQQRGLSGDGLLKWTSAKAEAICDAFLIDAAYVDLWRDEVIRLAKRAQTIGRASQFFLARDIVGLVEPGHARTPSELPGLHLTFPYMHRPLLTYVLGLPANTLVAPGEPRRLMKHAFSGMLPQRILGRFSKDQTVEPLRRAAVRVFASEYHLHPDRLEVVQRGFVDRRRMETELRHIAAHGETEPKTVREVMTLESWIRTLTRQDDLAMRAPSTASDVVSIG
jgi:Asparagine synthase